MKNKNQLIERIRKERKKIQIKNRLDTTKIRRFVINRYVLAVGAGIVVGLLYGFLSLSILLNDKGEVVGSGEVTPNVSTNHPDQKSTSTAVQKVDFPQLYAVQLGLFEKRSNAQESSQNFLSKKIATQVWERSEEYLLFASVHSEQSQAKKMVEILSEKDIDAFVKEWMIEVDEASLTESEKEIVQEFLILWTSSLAQVEADESFSEDKWQQFLKVERDDTEKIHRLIGELETAFKNNEEHANPYYLHVRILYLLEKIMGE